MDEACLYCEEPIGPGDETSPASLNGQRLHRECGVRMVAGSAAHQLKECSCYGGDREDPPGMSTRNAARLALDTYLELARGPAV